MDISYLARSTKNVYDEISILQNLATGILSESEGKDLAEHVKQLQLLSRLLVKRWNAIKAKLNEISPLTLMVKSFERRENKEILEKIVTPLFLMHVNMQQGAIRSKLI